MPDNRIYEVLLSEIKISDQNVRHADLDKELDDLADSIKMHGLLQPVVLRGEHGEPPYELVVGQRRYLAHKKLRMKFIRATFAGPLTDQQAAIRSLVENMHRVELSYADAAKAVTSLYRASGRDDRKVVSETGMSLRKVRQFIQIEELASEETKKKLRNKEVKPVDVQRSLHAAGGDRKKADQILSLMTEGKLTSHETKRVAAFGAASPKASADKIVKEAIRPRIETNIIVKLDDNVRKGLEKAAKMFAMDAEEVASRALQEWLLDKGFLHD